MFQDGASIHGLIRLGHSLLSLKNVTLFHKGTYIFISNFSIQGTTETSVCNNRGLCDTSTGIYVYVYVFMYV